MRMIHIYPKPYKTVERVIAYSWKPEVWEEHKNKQVEIVDFDVCAGFGIDFMHYDGLVSEIPKELLKKKCGNLIQLDNMSGNKFRIELK